MNCTYCKGPLPDQYYRLWFGDTASYSEDRSGVFCSKHHLMQWLSLGLDGRMVCEPYKPSPEETERMSQ
jgi:hypothetical protein